MDLPGRHVTPAGVPEQADRLMTDPIVVRGVIGLEPGQLVYAHGEPHIFIRQGCASRLGDNCGRQHPVTLQRIKPNGTFTMTMCFDANEVLQA